MIKFEISIYPVSVFTSIHIFHWLSTNFFSLYKFREKTKIAAYCASSTVCLDNTQEKLQKKFFSFFFKKRLIYGLYILKTIQTRKNYW